MSGPLDPMVGTTIAMYARDAWDAVKENYPLWGILREQGNIKYDQGGDPIIWPVEAGRYKPVVSAPGMDLSALSVTQVRHLKAQLVWGEITLPARLDRGLLRRNFGEAALVDLSKTEVPAMVRDLIIGPGYSATGDGSLSWQVLNQNYATYAGSGLPVAGFPSFLLAPSSTGLNGFNPWTYVVSGSAPAAADVEAVPTAASQSYAGYSMAYNGLSGIGLPEPDAWTPTLVNLGSSFWTGTAQQYPLAIGAGLQHAVNRTCRFDNIDPTYRGTFGILDTQYYEYLGNYLAAKQTLYMQPMQTEAMDSPNLGYAARNRLRHADTWFYQDRNCPTSTAFIINAQQMEFLFQKLFQDGWANGSPFDGVSGEDAGIIEPISVLDPITRSYIINLTTAPQMRANPRYFTRVGNYY